MLETDFQMLFYKLWFEKVIEMNQNQIKVIDATEGGAKIGGTIIQTLEETIERECKQYLDFYEIEKQIPLAFLPQEQEELLQKLRDMKDDVRSFRKKIGNMIVQQENLLANIEEDMISQEDLLRKLKDISEQYEKIEQETILEFISMYAHKEEFELGDVIYTEEDMGPKELLERGILLYKGYLNGTKMLEEDIEDILMKD